jgi:hypothetical protein
MNRMIKMENLLLEIITLFESVKLLDPTEDQVKEIEDQAKNCKYMFESNITEIIDECNNDIIQMGRRIDEMNEKIIKLIEFRGTVVIKDGQNDAKMSLLELNITNVDKRIDNTVIPSFRKTLEVLNERISRLETKPCNFPETIVTALEGTMDAKIEASNQKLMNREGELFAKIREVVREIMNPT